MFGRRESQNGITRSFMDEYPNSALEIRKKFRQVKDLLNLRYSDLLPCIKFLEERHGRSTDYLELRTFQDEMRNVLPKYSYQNSLKPVHEAIACHIFANNILDFEGMQEISAWTFEALSNVLRVSFNNPKRVIGKLGDLES